MGPFNEEVVVTTPSDTIASVVRSTVEATYSLIHSTRNWSNVVIVTSESFAKNLSTLPYG
jgi:hypothetical protein